MFSLFQEVRSVLFTEQNLPHSSACRKALLTPGCGEEKCSVHCRAEQEPGSAAHAQRTRLLDGVQGRGFQGSVQEGTARCETSLWTILGFVKMKFQASSTFCSQPV